MCFRNIHKIWSPAAYQGGTGRKQYFEGWYYKLVDSKGANTLAFIPGVSFDRNGINTHAFIQFINNSETASHYFRYKIDDFTFSQNTPFITIGKSKFSTHGIDLDIDQNAIRIKGRLDFKDIQPWPVSILSPGAMGWYAFVPFMECYHGVLSFDHSIQGELRIGGSAIDFTGGRGYIEKDWGRSFPKYHIWIQSNHFERENISIMASVASIPWLGKSFDGFLIGFWYDGQLYRFTTYSGAKISRLKYDQNKLVIHAKAKKLRIEIEADYKKGTELATPVQGEMRGRLSEGLDGEVTVRLYDVSSMTDMLLFEGIGIHAGVEIEGKIPDIAHP